LKWIEEHKAAIITILITGIITFSLFSIHITQKLPLVAETYIDMSPAELPEEQIIEEFLKQDNISDKAFNEDAAYKEMMEQFKSVPADDFEKTVQELSSNTTPLRNMPETSSKSINTSDYALKEEEKKRFEALKKQLEKNTIAKHSKSRSSFTYSLKNRQVLYYNTPRYLCEEGGKVVVNVLVKADGSVKECYVNSSSTSSNTCLLNHALDYAKEVVFNSADISEQLGTVTFYFKPKLAQ
jgi:hypothetical protein